MTNDLLLTAGKWLSGDVVRARTRPALAVVLLATFGAFVYTTVEIYATVSPLVHAPPVPALPPDHGDVRFGLSLAERRQIFDEFATAEPAARAGGKQSFPGVALEWSAEDHRGAFERRTAASLAAAHHLSLTQIYLCLDEGIRERWPGPDGTPLTPFTVPLNPRRKYGF